jgi:hypothetical protein
MESIWHIGIAVPDLEEGKREIGAVFGLRWRPARVRKLTLTDAAGRSREVEHPPSTSARPGMSSGSPSATAGLAEPPRREAAA